MSLVGTKRQFAQCKTTSGVGGKADLPVERPDFSVWTQRRHSSSAPPALIGLLLAVSTPRCLRVLSRRSMDAFNEKLCCRAARTILEGYDCDRPPPHGNPDWKDLERFVSAAEAQYRGWKDRHKLCARDQPEA